MANEKVTKRSHPHLDWDPQPRVFWLTPELVHSAAYRSLSKIESDILMFIMNLRQYPKVTKKTKRDYHQPINSHMILIPYKTVQAFLSEGGFPPPTESTITRAIHKLMAVGFIDVVHIGGAGPHDVSKYCLTHNWRIWKIGDPLIFTKAGLSRTRGFCVRQLAEA